MGIRCIFKIIMAEVRLSKKFSLQVPDFVRGAFMAVITPVLVFIQDWLDHDTEFNWKLVLKIAVGSLVGYLIKNFAFEPAKTIVSSDTNTKAVNANEKIKEAVH